MKNRKLLRFTFLFCVLLLVFSCDKKRRNSVAQESLEAGNLIIREPLEGRKLHITWESAEDTGSLDNGERANIVMFELQISKTEDFSEIMNTIKVGTPEVTIDNTLDDYKHIVSNGTVYYFRVRSINDSSHPESDYSYPEPSYYTFGTLSKAEAPSVPLSLKVEDVTISGNSVFVSWSPPLEPGKLQDGVEDAEIIGYKLIYSTQTNFTDSTTQTLEFGRDITDSRINNLEPTTTYYLKIAAKNNNGDIYQHESYYTDLVSFVTTDIMQSVPSVPKSLRVVEGSVSETSFNIRWDPPVSPGKSKGGKADATVVEYEVQYSTVSDFSVGSVNILVPARSADRPIEKQLMGLLRFITYYVRVRAINNNTLEGSKKSLFSDSIEGGVQTLPPSNSGSAERPSEVLDIKVTDIQDKIAVINWSTPAYAGRKSDGSPATLIGYRLNYSLSSDFSRSNSLIVPPGDNGGTVSMTLKSLKISSKYYVRVAAESNSDVIMLKTSKPSYLKGSFTTLGPAPPDPPVITLKVDKNDPQRSIVVSWEDSFLGFGGDGVTLSNFKSAIVEYALSSNFNTPREERSDTPNKIYIYGLEPNTEYYVRVKIINNNPNNEGGSYNTSVFSESVSLRTAPGFERPSGPHSVVANPVDGDDGRTEIRVSWEASANPGNLPDGSAASVVGYRVDYLLVLDDENFMETPVKNYRSEIVRGGLVSSTVLTNLIPNTAYRIRVSTINPNYDDPDQDVNSRGISLPANLSSLVSTGGSSSLPKVHASPHVKNLSQVSNPTHNTVTLVIPPFEGSDKWGVYPDGNSITSGSRRLQMKTGAGDYTDITEVTLSAEQQQDVLVKDLQSRTTYVFRVVVRNEQREETAGDDSNDIITLSLPTPPLKHPAPTYAGRKTHSSLQIKIPAFTATDKWGISSAGDVYTSGRRTLYKSTNVYGPYEVVRVKIPESTEVDQMVEVVGLKPGTSYYFKIGVDNLNPSFNTSKSEASAPIVTEVSTPGPPREVDVKGGARSFTVTWQPPYDDGGSHISAYEILYSSGYTYDAGDTNAGVKEVSGGTFSHTVTGLKNDQSYAVVVRAKSSNIIGVESESSTDTTYSIPDAVTGVTTSHDDDTGTITINWFSPANTATKPVDGYRIKVTENSKMFDESNNEKVGTIISHNGNYQYTYTDSGKYGDLVYAIFPYNDITGEATSYAGKFFHNEKVTTEPGNISVVSGRERSVVVSWSEPVDLGGGSIIKYKVYYSTESDFDISTAKGSEDERGALTHIINVPDYNRYYYFIVTAFNNAGESPASVCKMAATAGVPSEPINLSITASTANSVTLSWGDPSNDGRSDIKAYEVYFSKTNNPATVRDPHRRITGTTLAVINPLDANTTYNFTVYAVNNAGRSEKGAVISKKTESW